MAVVARLMPLQRGEESRRKKRARKRRAGNDDDPAEEEGNKMHKLEILQVSSVFLKLSSDSPLWN